MLFPLFRVGWLRLTNANLNIMKINLDEKTVELILLAEANVKGRRLPSWEEESFSESERIEREIGERVCALVLKELRK